MMWGIIRTLCGLTVMLLVMQTVRADVIQRVTFTVKNDGTVVAETDIGTFDMAGKVLTVSASQMPDELRDATILSSMYGKNDIAVSPVGFEDGVPRSDRGPLGTAVPFRVSKFTTAPGEEHDNAVLGNCDAGSRSGKLRINTDSKPFSSRCTSHETYSGYRPLNRKLFMAEELQFQYLEKVGGAQWLATQKLPVGTYTLQRVFDLTSRHYNAGQIKYVRWVVDLKVIVEPSMAEVNMPSRMEMAVRDTGNNRLVGEGTVQISAQGTLGRNLRIEPRSANGGKLIKGTEDIPYTLSISALAGDFSRHVLIENGSVQTATVIPLYGRDFDYPLRLNANFDVPKSGLTSGDFSDRVTLVFSTTDVP